MSPRGSSPALGEQREYWDERWSRTPDPNAWQERRADTILRMLERLPRAPQHILDLGCATGWFTARLARLGDVTGIDLSEQAIALARMRHPDIRFQAGDIYTMPLPRAHYDLVVAQEVVAHVPDQARFVDVIAGSLAPGGYLVISAANKVVMDRVDFGPDSDAHIKRWLTLGDLKRLVQPQFRVLDATSIIPFGEKGILRLINSPRLNRLVGGVMGHKRLEEWKERAALGYSVIVLARKRS
ncbi:MAG TPA: class I SAM-dependent methyltransferase [Solirubrobacteraceae bacterium]|nr:class I SAM-dependent methyltransferase [Solirubrobacteraceae bacterium]